MSLFASAFESGSAAGPSTSFATSFPTSHSGKTSGKRRRLSGAADSKNDPLRSAQQNLEKLMKDVDTGRSGNRLQEKEGREGMGSMPAKKKNKGRAEREREKEKALGASFVPQPRQRGPKQEKEVKSPKGKEQVGGTPKGKKEKKDKAHKVEIPVPPSPSAKEVETDGLTSMQKGMKSKLEGARFR
jgi:ribosomal RNA-processing protein 8